MQPPRSLQCNEIHIRIRCTCALICEAGRVLGVLFVYCMYMCVTAWMPMCKCLYVLYTEEVGGCAHMHMCGNDSECVIGVCVVSGV